MILVGLGKTALLTISCSVSGAPYYIFLLSSLFKLFVMPRYSSSFVYLPSNYGYQQPYACLPRMKYLVIISFKIIEINQKILSLLNLRQYYCKRWNSSLAFPLICQKRSFESASPQIGILHTASVKTNTYETGRTHFRLHSFIRFLHSLHNAHLIELYLLDPMHR